MLTALHVALTLWPWKQASIYGAAVGIFTFLLNILGGEITMAGVINPLGFAVMVFFALGGILSFTQKDPANAEIRPAKEWALQHPWLFAVPPAIGAAAPLFALRLIALYSGAEGPWSSFAESALDISFRVAVVYAIVAAASIIDQRSESTQDNEDNLTSTRDRRNS